MRTRRVFLTVSLISILSLLFLVVPNAQAVALKCTNKTGGYSCFSSIPPDKVHHIRDLLTTTNETSLSCFLGCAIMPSGSETCGSDRTNLKKEYLYDPNISDEAYKACKLDSSTGILKTIACGDGASCSKSEQTCTTNKDCKQDVGNYVCNNNFCYYDAAAAAFAKKADASILGIDAQIHLQKPQPSIRIPGLTFSEIEETLDSQGYLSIPYLGEYIAALYKFGMAVASAIAVVLIIKKGFDIAISPGGEVKQEAYQRIGQIIAGLVLVWGSYGILYAINPQLVAFNVLKVKYIEPVELSDRIATPDDDNIAEIKTNQKLPSGFGDYKAANLLDCPPLVPGAKFEGAFTTYVNLKKYGDPSGYSKNYTGSPTALGGMGAFFCAVAMECNCPNGGKKDPQGLVCSNSNSSWAPCAYFDANTPFCVNTPGRYVPGKTVAASVCFPYGTLIKVGGDDNHIVKVTDVGSGIVGTHFDLYLGRPGESTLVQDTSWLSTHLEIVSVGKPHTQATIDKMRKNYNYYARKRYPGGICTPGKNC